MRRAVAALVAALAAVTTVLASPARAVPHAAHRSDRGRPEGPLGVAYRPPVDAPLLEVFRAPATAYGAGNRGIDYATTTGQPVAAAAGGEVVFAGRVGGGLHAVVLHPDGIRTTYSFLESLAVRRGDRVDGGQAVGTAGGALHFGARAGEVYLDPIVLLGGGRVVVRLVPDGALRAESEARERVWVERMLRGVARAVLDSGGDAVGWAWEKGRAEVAERVDELRGWLHYAAALGVPLQVRILVATAVWHAEQDGCTPADVEPPAPVGRRLAVLVGGLGSATGNAAVLDVDTAALGYAPADVTQFSYGPGAAYGPADTQVSIDTSAARLADHVRRLQAANPGVPVDVIAHSQGGLVARAALVGGLEGVSTLVTLGTPHKGADLATAAVMVGHGASGGLALWGFGEAEVRGIDPNSTSVRQMAETSELIRRLADSPLPDSTRVVSVAARHDLVVTSPRSRLRGADNVVVTVGTGAAAVMDHSRLPGSAAARREIGLALAGLAPTCQTFADLINDVAVGQSAAFAEDAAGAALAAGGRVVDARVGRR